MGDSAWTRLWGLAVLAILLAHAASYLPFMADDAFISLRYSERLVDGQGLTWNDGERVEGYSNLLLVLGCAALGGLGLDLITAARALGLASAALATLVLVFRYRHRLSASIATGMALALSGPLAAWSVGGLEGPLVAALLAWALATGLSLIKEDSITWKAAVLGPGMPLALLCWTRPDGALFTAAVAAGLVASHGLNVKTMRSVLRISALPAGAYLAQLAFRLAYYGEWVPNVAYAKVSFTANRALEGATYLGKAAVWLSPLVVISLALSIHLLRGATASTRRATTASTREGTTASGRVRFLLVPLLIWSAYVAFIGGDIFPARRHVIPLLVILAFLLGESLLELRDNDRMTRAGAWALTFFLMVTLGTMQWFDPENQRARQERWEWDSAAIGRMLNTAFHQQQPLLAVDAAGALPYFSKLPTVDMLGLNDRYLAHNRPSDMGQGWLGHELGDGAYVLQREPDIIQFCGPALEKRPCFRSGKEMVQDPLFSRRYRRLTLQTGPPREVLSFLWIRIDGGRLGLTRSEEQIHLPGYLFVSTPGSVVTLDEQDRPGVIITPQSPAGFDRLDIPAGHWILDVESGPGEIRTAVLASGTSHALGLGQGHVRFTMDEPGMVDLLVASTTATRPHLLGATLQSN